MKSRKEQEKYTYLHQTFYLSYLLLKRKDAVF